MEISELYNLDLKVIEDRLLGVLRFDLIDDNIRHKAQAILSYLYKNRELHLAYLVTGIERDRAEDTGNINLNLEIDRDKPANHYGVVELRKI